jgi:lon-related putative ATP-dependent protease
VHDGKKEEPDMVKEFPEVPVSELRFRVDSQSLPFENTSTLEPPVERVLGQERASDAIKFGMGMRARGYHIFVAGHPKTGLTYIAKTYIEEQAKKEPTPPDWCYVFNFKEPDKPKCLSFRSGRGKEFQKDMRELVTTLQAKIPEVFDSDDYRAKEKEVHQEFERLRHDIMEELSQLAKDEGFILQVSQVGMVVIPATEKGQPMGQEDLAQLGDEDKKGLREKSDELHRKMKEAIKRIREHEAEFKEKHGKLDREVALFVVGQHLEALSEKYKDESGVVEFLKMVQEDVVENIDDFKKKQEAPAQAQGQVQPGAQFPALQREAAFRKYEVNVLVDNSDTQGAPVIVESNPTYPNLFGSIERQAWFGALFTDFTMLKPGVLHKANGGYLVMKALDLIKWYFSWEAVKRALRDQEIRIEDLGELYGLFSTKTIRPEPIPLDIKIVLTGDPYLFELIHFYDDQFQKLFKVKAHLDDRIDRKEDTTLQLARMIGNFCREQSISHFDRSGVARLLEYSMERTEDREKLSLELGDMGDLMREADYFARVNGDQFIGATHVEEAIRKRIFRSNLVEERIKELVKDDILWIETDRQLVGQINGLSILMTGDHEFGKPNRITATVSVGREGVVAIEREAKLSGSIHTKGVMILTNFLKDRFAHNKPLSLAASLCFEQSYGLVEGDSASSTELYALLSALAGVPIDQGVAVTGSISQKGEIQPVGGVTRKIEAFYDICKHKGLSGRQGVIIPAKNVRHLMLKQDVVDSVEKGEFHIWPIDTVEEGVPILMGLQAGTLGADGTYEEGTLFRKVDDRFLEIADIVKAFGKEEGASRKEGEEEEGPPCAK